MLVLEMPGFGEEEYMTVVISQSRGKVIAVPDGDSVRYELKLLVDGRIEDQTGSLDLIARPDQVASINRRVAAVIQHDIEMALAKAQSLQADVFGLGWLLYRTRYQGWLQIQDRWHEMFPRIVMDLDIRANIRRSGLINRTGILR